MFARHVPAPLLNSNISALFPDLPALKPDFRNSSTPLARAELTLSDFKCLKLPFGQKSTVKFILPMDDL